MNKLITFIFIISILSISVGAESGTLTISGTKVFTGVVLGSGAVSAPDFSKLYVYSGGYNKVYGIQIYNNGFTVDNDVSSTFHVSAGGTGSGTVYANKTVPYIAWVFDSGGAFTQNKQTIVYDSNPNWANVVSGGGWFRDAEALSDTKPCAVGVTAADGAMAGNTAYYVCNMALTIENRYNVSYLTDIYGNQLFNATIEKSGTVGTRFKVNTSNGIVYDEGSVTLLNRSKISNYTGGLYLEIISSIGTGTGAVLINSSGCGSCVPSTPIDYWPSEGVNFFFDKTQYTIGDNINMSWYIANNSWSWYKSYALNIYENDVKKGSFSVQQTGNYLYTPENLGIIKFEIEYGLLSSSVLGYDTRIVSAESPSYLAFNTTQYSKKSFNITYHIGYSLSGYSSTNMMVNIVSKTRYNTVDTIYNIGTSTDGQITAQNVRMYPVDEYTVQLFDSKKNKVIATKPLSIVLNSSSIPKMNITTSNITMDRSFYFINDYAEIDYRADDTNYTNLSLMATVTSEKTGQTTKQLIHSFSRQVDHFQEYLNNKDDTLTCDLNSYCWYETGNNTIKLIGYNNTHQIELAFFNFSISETTLDGWGLKLSKQNASTTDKITIKTTVPAGSNGMIRIRDAGYNENSTAVFKTSVASGTNTYFTQITRVSESGIAYYEVELIDSSTGNIKLRIPLTIYKTTTPTDTGFGNESTASNILGSGWFWAAILMFGFLLSGAVYAGASGAIGGLSVGVIFSYIGNLIPLWAVMVFVIVIIAMVAFMLSGGMSKTGGGD